VNTHKTKKTIRGRQRVLAIYYFGRQWKNKLSTTIKKKVNIGAAACESSRAETRETGMGIKVRGLFRTKCFIAETFRERG